MACSGQRQVKVTEKEGTNKMDGEEKKRKSGKKGVSHTKKKCMESPWGNRPTTPTKKALGPALSTTSTSGKDLHVQSLNTFNLI